MIFLMAVLAFCQSDAPTPVSECEKMCKQLKLTKKDVFYDLGCGDGRLVTLVAMRSGCRAVGIDYDAKKVELAKKTVKENGVGHLVRIYHADLLHVDFEKLTVTVFYLYLPRELIEKLTPKLLNCPGVTIVSYIHPLPLKHKKKVGDFFIYEIPKREK